MGVGTGAPQHREPTSDDAPSNGSMTPADARDGGLRAAAADDNAKTPARCARRARPAAMPVATLAAVLAAATLLLAGVGRSETHALVWPLDATPLLTSSFGEFRRSHLHAGIDLATGGRNGLRCFAVHDGYVARLRMSPFGYGKAIYVQLDSGPLVVYAHLSRFASRIAERAREEQRKRRRYTFDVYLQPNEIRVRRGDVIAWSGDTGVGFPHLHFEMRDGDVARNPQTAGFPVTDRVAPVIRDVSILPQDALSHVEGEVATYVIAAADAHAGAEPVRAAGRLGFAVRAVDLAAKGPYRQAPYRYEVRVDGELLYQATHERFDYAHNHHIVLEYDQERLLRRDRRSFQLFAKRGNALAGRNGGARGRGVLHTQLAGDLGERFAVRPGRHEVEIELADVAGNHSAVRFPLWISTVPRIERLLAFPVDGGFEVVCEVYDADGDSVDVSLEASFDAGVTWSPVEDLARESVAEPSGNEARHTAVRWSGRIRPGPVGPLLRARARDASALEAYRSWGAAESSTLTPSLDAVLEVDVRTIWRDARLDVRVTANATLAQTPALALVLGDGRTRRIRSLRQVGPTEYRWVRDVGQLGERLAALELTARALDGRRHEARVALPARIVRPGRRYDITDLHPRCALTVEPETFFDAVAIRMRDFDSSRLPLGRELTVAGACVAIESRGAALNRRIRVRLGRETQRAADAPASGLFYVKQSGDIEFLSAERDTSGALTGQARYLTVFAELADDTPPRVERFRRVGKRPRLQFRANDGGAGLGADAIDVQIDGRFAIPEWDPETGRVLVHPFRELASGSHEMSVRVADRVGNSTERTWTFDWP